MQASVVGCVFAIDIVSIFAATRFFFCPVTSLHPLYVRNHERADFRFSAWNSRQTPFILLNQANSNTIALVRSFAFDSAIILSRLTLHDDEFLQPIDPRRVYDIDASGMIRGHRRKSIRRSLDTTPLRFPLDEFKRMDRSLKRVALLRSGRQCDVGDTRNHETDDLVTSITS